MRKAEEKVEHWPAVAMKFVRSEGIIMEIRVTLLFIYMQPHGSGSQSESCRG